MLDIKGDAGHAARCVRYDEIDWARYRPKGVETVPLHPGKSVLQIKDMKKYYEIRDNSIAAMFSGQRSRFVKANEKLDFEAREAETVAVVGESGCGKTTFAKVLMGLEESTSGEVLVNGIEVGRMPVRKRPAGLISNLQIVFLNSFENHNLCNSFCAQI